jgi:hypothetical protein
LFETSFVVVVVVVFIRLIFPRKMYNKWRDSR